MPLIFDPATVADQVWIYGQQIEPLQLPTASGGPNIAYTLMLDDLGQVEGLPPGVRINEDTRTLFGTPEQIGTGQFAWRAVDENGQEAVLEVSWDVLTGRPALHIPPIPELSFVPTQQVDYAFPAPVGGSGRFTAEILPMEYYPELPFGSAWANEGLSLLLPEGLTFDADGQRLTGTVQDAQANRGGTLSSPTLNNAQVQVLSGGRRQFTGTVGASGAPDGWYWSAASGTIDNQPHVWQRVFTYSGNVAPEDAAVRGGLRIELSGTDIHTGPHLIGNNPFLRFIDLATGRQHGPTFWWVYAGQPSSPGLDLNWPRTIPGTGTLAPTNFRFEHGHSYSVELNTLPSNQYRYRVTDTETGEVAERVFQINLLGLAVTPPPTPTLAPGGLTNTQTTISVRLTPVPPGAVAGALYAVAETEGAPPVSYRPVPGFDPAAPAVRAEGLVSNRGYDLYVRYEDSRGRRGAPGIFTSRTEPSRAAQAPGQPEDVVGRPGNSRGQVRWRRQDGWQEIVRYEYRINGGPPRVMAASDGTITAYTIPGLTNGVEVAVEIRAVNDSGAGAWSLPVRIIPAADINLRPPGQSNLTLQVLIDPDGRGEAWLGISTRVVGCRLSYGRQPGATDFTFGYADVEVECSDDFISSGGQGVYTAGELRQKLCYINVLVEDDAGWVSRWTAFGGWIEAVEFRSREERATVILRVVDRLAQLERAPVRFTTPLPRETIRQRMIRYLDGARGGEGVAYDLDNLDDPQIFCDPINASADQPFEGNLMPLLQQAAHSAGGRIYIQQAQRFGVGTLRFEARGPQLGVAGTITDDPEGDLYRFPSWAEQGPIIEAGDRPITEGDPANIYNVAELSHPASDELIIRRNTRSIASPLEGGEGWGERKWPITDVITERDATEALAEHIVRVYAQPRYWAQQITLPVHHRTPRQAAAIVSASLDAAFRIAFLPPRAPNRIVAIQKVDGVDIQFVPLGIDDPHCQMWTTYSLLAPEVTAYWVVDRAGDNALGEETVLSPDLAGDQFLRGHFDWRYSDADISRAQVTATRYNRLFTSQMWPVYVSEAERDLTENAPLDGESTIIAGTRADNTRFFQLQVWSEPDNQWLIRGALSETDANPVFDTFTWDTDKWDDAKVWGA